MCNRFTLVEVLITAVLSVIVLSIISGAVWMTLQAVEATDNRAYMTQENAALIRRLSEDLRGSRLNVYRSTAELLELQEDEAEPPTFFAESDERAVRLDMFTTGAVTGPRKPAGIYRVFYRFDGPNGALERRQAHIAQVDIDELPWRVIADDLEFISLSFFDGEEWKSAWDSNEEGDLPLAIEVTFARARNAAKSRCEFIVSPRIRD